MGAITRVISARHAKEIPGCNMQTWIRNLLSARALIRVKANLATAKAISLFLSVSPILSVGKVESIMRLNEVRIVLTVAFDHILYARDNHVRAKETRGERNSILRKKKGRSLRGKVSRDIKSESISAFRGERASNLPRLRSAHLRYRTRNIVYTYTARPHTRKSI